jgi:membrane fusion protein (multidrug efflux system)
MPAGRAEPSEAPAEESRAAAGSRRRRSLVIKILVAVVVLVAAAAVIWPWLESRWAHVSVDDARIGGSLVTLSSAVSDTVSEVPVDTGDRVSAGQLLVAIDTATTRLELKQLDAELDALAAQQAQLRAQEDLLRRQLQSKSDAASAQLAGAQADQKSANAALANAKAAFDRIAALRERQVAAAQEYDQAQATFIQAEQQELRAEAAIRSAEANIAGVEADRAQIPVIERQVEGLDAQIKAKQAERDQKHVELDQRVMKAAFSGVVDATFVRAGEYVTPGQRVLIYHDPRSVWVDANVKETDLRSVKVGAPVAVYVDAYPGRVFRGRVVAISNATNSQFALLPSPNPSGNFTKVTQRVPIKIALDQVDDLLRPGMMVEASIDVVH